MSPKQKLDLLVDFFQNHSFSISEPSGELLIEASEEDIRNLLSKPNDGDDFDLLFASTGSNDSYRLAGGKNLFEIDIFDSKDKFSKNLKAIRQSKNYLVQDPVSKEYISWIEGQFHKSDGWKNDNFFFSNIFSFIGYVNRWIEIGKEANTSDKDYSFIDYYNTQKETFLLTTFSQKTQLKQPTLFSENEENLATRLELFNSCFSVDSKDQFPKFIKKNLIDFISEFNIEERLYQSYIKFDKIYDKANLDFQVYLHDVSVDALRDGYEDFKRESLMPFSEITSKLTIKILSVPIAFSAILFSLSKITNSVLQIGVIFSLLISSIILNFSLKNHFSDLKSIYRLFGKKVKKIKEHNFFVKNPEEKSEIREVINYIEEKLKYSQRFIWSYFFISSILFLFVCVYFLWPLLTTIDFEGVIDVQLFTNQYVVVLTLMVFYLVVTIIQAFVFKKDSKALKSITNDYSINNF